MNGIKQMKRHETNEQSVLHSQYTKRRTARRTCAERQHVSKQSKKEEVASPVPRGMPGGTRGIRGGWDAQNNGDKKLLAVAE
ncbi:hypothetical protein EAG_06392 [Camponotus floridanus]|uniref:Uncharacterized protein n=1 Tax=Camponotus floridanus TaxID=104421 RepID=E2B0J4_CAMFO|nr:hypothetical protein EAG_06392 [Camponotus floridanus]